MLLYSKLYDRLFVRYDYFKIDMYITSFCADFMTTVAAATALSVWRFLATWLARLAFFSLWMANGRVIWWRLERGKHLTRSAIRVLSRQLKVLEKNEKPLCKNCSVFLFFSSLQETIYKREAFSDPTVVLRKWEISAKRLSKKLQPRRWYPALL